MNNYANPTDFDRRLSAQAAPANSPQTVDKKPGENWSEKLPDLLRKAGAIAVLISLYSFLSKGWAGSNDLIKYFMLLGNTVGLTVVALLIGNFFKEGKSARLLLTLGLVSVPINFAILGAFVFYGASDLIGVSYPGYVAWRIESLSTALIISVLATCVLVPVMMLGFKTLARGMSQRMTLFFLLSNVLLLVPFRNPTLVAAMAVALGLLTLFISAKTARQKIEAKTKEGRMALLLQFLPLGILVGRNLWLYAADEIVVWAASAMAFIAFRQISFLVRSNSWPSMLINGVAFFTALTTGVLTTQVLLEMHLASSFSVLMGILFSSAMMYEISLREGVNESVYRTLSMSILVIGSMINLFALGGFAISLSTLLIGIALLVSSFVVQQRSMSIAGAVMTVVALVDQTIIGFQWFDIGSWVVLLFVGVGAIVIASVLETRSDSLKRFLKQHRKQLGQWSF
jgi:hypothetical protein